LRKEAGYISNRSTVKAIRFTEKELKEILLEAEKSGLNLSEYIRSCASGRLNDNPEFRKCLQELTYEVHKIGININQIAYHYNAGMLSRREKELLFELMKDIRKGVFEIAAYGNHKTTNHSDQ